MRCRGHDRWNKGAFLKRSFFLQLFGLALGLLLLVGVFQQAPGYMDADYYYMGGVQLAQGEGFTEKVLWNYLSDPQGLPQPSHGYWMPFASLVAAAGLKWFGWLGEFNAARLGFILAAASIPPLTAWFAFKWTQKQDISRLAGWLACFPGFYLPFLTTTDTFGLYMVFGLAWLILAGFSLQEGAGSAPGLLAARSLAGFAGMGAMAGLMHLSRADGFTWLGVGFLASFYNAGPLPIWVRLRQAGLRTVALAAGYALVFGPWALRNLGVFNSILAPGGVRALWLTTYDELFIYPSTMLTFEHWWAAGWESLLQARAFALGQNLQTTLAVQGSIFLLPLVLVGLWTLRREGVVQLGVLGWLVTMGVMTVIFPFAGARGGFFHSGAAVQPLFWLAAAVGLDVFVRWGSQARGWRPRQAWRIFSFSVVLFSAGLSLFIGWGRVIGTDPQAPAWNAPDGHYRQVESQLQALGAQPDDVVMINNPPGYFAAASRPAIVVPDGGEGALLAAARRYQARFVVLEANHPAGLAGLFEDPGASPGLRLLDTVGETRIFEVLP